MKEHVPVKRLFETHLTVADLDRSMAFYRDVVHLGVGLEMPERGAVFFWVGEPGDSMLGLWSTGSMPMGMRLHIAFEVELSDLLDAPRRLRDHEVTPLSFFGTETNEPDVLAWMPAGTLYFADPDGHALEYIAMLDAKPRPDLGVIPWSRWTDIQADL